MAMTEIPVQKKSLHYRSQPRSPLDISDVSRIARKHTQASLNTLAEIIRDKDQPGMTRIAAANSILDRGWGKSTQSLTGMNGNGGIEVIIRHIVEDHVNEPKTIEHGDELTSSDASGDDASPALPKK